MDIRRKQTLGSALVALSLVAAACGGGTSSSTGRKRNAELSGGVPAATLACAAGGIGPSGGLVVSVDAGTGVEAALETKLFEPPTFEEALAQAMNFASTYTVNGVTGWSLPTSDLLIANSALINSRLGSTRWWASDTKYNKPAYVVNGTSYGMWETPYRLNARPRAVLVRTFTESSEPCLAPTTTTAAPTTTLPTCSTTADCTIGYNGPGGGTVVLATEVRDAEAVYIEYVEMTKAGWDGRQDPFYGPKNDAKSKVASYRGGGLSDWRVMSQTELSRVCRAPIPAPYTDTGSCLNGFAFGGKDYGNRDDWTYWTTESFAANTASYDILNNRTDTLREVQPRVRPVRSWRVLKVSLTTVATTTTTSTTVAPTTTWAAANTSTCSDLSNCTVGQRGPGGGTIIYKEIQGGTPVYWEVAPVGWNGGTQDSNASASYAKTLVSEYRGGGLSDWTLPDTYIAIQALCHYAGGRDPMTKDPCVENASIKPAFGDGKSTRRGEYYWAGSKSGATQKTDLVSGHNLGDLTGFAYVRPMRVFVYVPPTTTTTIPKTCAQGGKCAVGDISPAGNLIIAMEGSGNSISYTEIAPREWAPANLYVANNYDDVRLIKSAALSTVSQYRGAGASDWRLPTIADMRAAFVYFTVPKFRSDCSDDRSNAARTITQELRPFRIGYNYWVTDPSQPNRYISFDAATGAVYYDAHRYMTPWGYKYGETTMKYGVRPMRTVRYTGPSMTVAPYVWAPAKCEYTSPPTSTVTTQPATCRQGGRCVVGDVGPFGGIIIAVNSRVTDGPQYTEMSAFSGWDCQGTSLGSSCLEREWDNGSFQTPFGKYPTPDELIAVARDRNLVARLGLRRSGYWTDKYVTRSGILSADFTGNLNEMGRSLKLNEIDAALAVNMSNGRPVTTSYAYFRGVVRWNCRAACVP